MRKLDTDTAADPAPGRPEAGEPVLEQVPGRAGSPYLILCDHASAHVPAEYGTLGLAVSEFDRHIAYDIGAREVTLGLADRLGAPALLSRFSRLLIDPNRGMDDPTLVMRIADGAIVPANARADQAEITRRIQRFHGPYHAAIDAAIDRAIAAGRPPALVAIHSFTPRFKSQARPWHATVLWDSDPRLPRPLLEALRGEGGLIVGENVPYSGRLHGDTLYRHGTCRGLAHALLEIRQDIVATPAGAAEWADRLARILDRLAALPDLGEIRPGGASHGAGTPHLIEERQA
jgi:predicted N-formylglutamate amidohydrolase